MKGSDTFDFDGMDIQLSENIRVCLEGTVSLDWEKWRENGQDLLDYNVEPVELGYQIYFGENNETISEKIPLKEISDNVSKTIFEHWEASQ